MKLSDKGYEKLNKHAYIQSDDPFMHAELDKDSVCEVELEPDDFVGTVMLTIEEAKLVKKALAIASCPSFAYSDTYFAFFKEMEKRIKQVESGK